MSRKRASTFVDAMASSDRAAWNLEKTLVKAAAQHRPQCKHWGTREGCNRGRKCKFRHDDEAETELRLYGTCRVLDEDTGAVVVVPWPPLKEAARAAFESRKRDQ